MDTIDKLTQFATSFRDQRDWKQFHNIKDMLLSLILETSELAELFQWKKEKEVSEIDKENIGEELSDILYWVLLISHDLDIDLTQAYKLKMEKNSEKYPIEKSYGKSVKYDKL